MKENVIIDIVYHGLKEEKEAKIDQYMFRKYLKENFPNFIIEDGKILMNLGLLLNLLDILMIWMFILFFY